MRFLQVKIFELSRQLSLKLFVLGDSENGFSTVQGFRVQPFKPGLTFRVPGSERERERERERSRVLVVEGLGGGGAWGGNFLITQELK